MSDLLELEWDESTNQYKVNRPGDQSGTYIRVRWCGYCRTYKPPVFTRSMAAHCCSCGRALAGNAPKEVKDVS